MVRIPRRSVLLVSALAVVASGMVWHPLSPAGVAIGGALLTAAVAREDRFLLGVSLAAFAVRAILAVALHMISALDVEVTRPWRDSLGPGSSFWIFALDSKWYHVFGVQMLSMWSDGTEFPRTTSSEYVFFIGVVYRLFGVHPLNAILWNALFGALTVVLGYRIAARLAGPTAARVTAVLIGFWPSAILWSSQLLKDTICIWLVLAVLYLTMRIVEFPRAARSWPLALARWTGQLALLFAAAFLLHRVRFYLLLILIPAPAVFIVQALVQRTRQAPWRIFAACVVVAVTFLSLSLSRRIEIERLMSPPDPEIVRMKLGTMAHARGDLDLAVAHYRRALTLVHEYPPALKGLAAVAIARDDRGRGVAYLEHYLARVPTDIAARDALDVLRSMPEGTSLRGVPPLDLAFVPPEASPQAVAPRIVAPPAPPDVVAPYRDAGTLITKLRLGFALTGGSSTIDREVRFHGVRDILLYVPRALGNVLFTPYPSQWFTPQGGAGPFKALSAVEVILVYVLIVPMLVGLGVVVWRGSPDALYLAAYVLASSVLLGLVVNNVGTLFRLRLTSLLPLFAAGGLGWIWLVRGRRGST